MVSVALRNITKFYGDVMALDNISFKAESSQITVLLGPSGCGKTTTLKIIAGFLPPDKGQVFFDNKLVNDVPPQERNIGFVFQNIALFPHLTVYDNIAFGLEVRRWDKEKIDARVHELLHLLRLDGLEKRYPRELSGGQQQRVGLARALSPQPNVLLLDEPLSSLDANLRESLKFEIQRIQRETKVTAIYVTHDLAEAFSIGDKIIVINNGKIIQEGSPVDIYFYPKNRFVAKFLRISNFIKGTVTEKKGDVILIETTHGNKFKIKISGGQVKALTLGESVTFMLMPTDLRINLYSISGANILKGEVKAISYEAFYFTIVVSTEEGDLRVVSMSKELLKQIKLGAKIFLSFADKAPKILAEA